MENFKYTLILSLLISASMASVAQTGTRYVDAVFSEITVEKDIVYGHSTPYLDVNQTQAGPLTACKMDIYSPKGDIVTKRPTIVMAHSGAFVFGNKEQEDQIFLATEFARRGYVTAVIDYRLMVRAGKDQYIPILNANTHATEDLYGAIRFLRVNAQKYGIDTGRIGTEGHSAGGAMVLFGTFSHDKVLCENNGGLDAEGKPLASSEFSTGVAIGSAWPLGISKDDRPVKVILGSSDEYNNKPIALLGNLRPWELMQQQAKGVMDLDLTILPEKGHEFYPDYKDTIVTLLVAWYKKHLIEGPRIGDDGTSPATADTRIGTHTDLKSSSSKPF